MLERYENVQTDNRNKEAREDEERGYRSKGRCGKHN